VLPFQCRINVLPLLVAPTAQAFFEDVAVAPNSSPLGPDCRFHEVPFQCWIRVVPARVVPTTQALRADVAATAEGWGMEPAGFGTGSGFQADPFQRRIAYPPAEPLKPTAHTSRLDVADRLWSPSAENGLRTFVQVLPFHRSIRAWPWLVALKVSPTAQALRAESAATLDRLLWSGLGLGTRFHALPFQCRISVLTPDPVLTLPTAQASLAEIAATPSRRLPAGLGLGSCFQALPFHRSIRARDPLAPTAQALRTEMAATLLRLLLVGPGLGTRFQVLPFQCTISVLELGKLPAEPTAQALPAEVAATPARLPFTVKPAAALDRDEAASAGLADAIPAIGAAAKISTARNSNRRAVNSDIWRPPAIRSAISTCSLECGRESN
jgi:hypothetical protein